MWLALVAMFTSPPSAGCAIPQLESSAHFTQVRLHPREVRKAVQVSDQLLQDPCVRSNLDAQAEIHKYCASLLGNIGEHRLALTRIRAALDIYRLRPGEHSQNLIQSLDTYALLLNSAGKPYEAGEALKEALSLCRVEKCAPDTEAKFLMTLGGIHYSLQDPPGALRQFRRAEKLLGNTPAPEFAATLDIGIAVSLVANGELAEGDRVSLAALQRATTHFPEGHPMLAQAWEARAVVLTAMKRKSEAAEATRQARAFKGN